MGFSRRVLALSVLSLCAACGSSMSLDGGLPPVDMAPPMDAGVDAPHSELYGPCTADSDCPGVGAICRRNVDGWPQGYCTVPCTDRTPCDDGLSYNHCLDDGTGHSFCEHRCLNGIDCGRDGYSCQGNYPPADGKCIPVCSSDAVCGTGAVCQVETGHCVAPGTAPPAGSPVGGPCTTNAGCQSGICEPEIFRGAPTGFVHGTCIGYCILPAGFNPTNYYSGADLPQGTCGSGQVCIPISSASAPGDLGGCSTGCHSNADCRASEGYYCRQTIGTSHFGVGFCEPIDCSTMGPCPTGTTCHMTSGGNFCATM